MDDANGAVLSAESKRRKIMLVDDNMTNLSMGKNMLKEFYEIFPIPSGAKLLSILEKVVPDLILLDIEMPEMNGYQVIQALKKDKKWMDIPVIFLTSKSDEGSELEGLSFGAIDYVAKPFSAPLLLKRIENHLLIASQKMELKNYNDNLQEMVRAKTEEVLELQNSVYCTLAEMVEFRDSVTGSHIERTRLYLEVLVKQLIQNGVYADEVAKWNLEFLFSAAQLHDVGKVAISDAILNKPGRLTQEEFEIMKKHVEFGVQAITRIENRTREHSFLSLAKSIAATHHEKWDGTGYPAGLSGPEIPLEGRLMAIADVYDALISTRPYKRPLTTEEAEKIINSGKGTHFDPVLVDIFNAVSGQFAAIAQKNP